LRIAGTENGKVSFWRNASEHHSCPVLAPCGKTAQKRDAQKRDAQKRLSGSRFEGYQNLLSVTS
jgi:hypothetical protein